MDFSEYKNLWVFIETDEGKAVSSGLELLNPGAELAWEDLLYALSPGEEAEISVDLAAGYGTLPSGQYRLVKRYSVSGQEGEEELCLEFSVDGGEADAPQE